MWTRLCGIRGPRPLIGLVAAALLAATLSGCGAGDSTVAKTPQPATHPTATPRTPAPPPVVAAGPTSSA
ncbi:MAG: LppP/LprE family lipoprotein, partial [Mycobacterium sp.]